MRLLISPLLALALVGLAGLARAEDDKAGKPEVGKPAPDFTLQATQIDKAAPDKKDAKTLSLKDLQGKTVVLYFYPKALTGG
jgi:peroxiredoxin Q/BCP